MILLPIAATLGTVLYGLFETVRLNKAAEKHNVLGAFAIGVSLLVLWGLVIIADLVAWLLYFAFT